MNLLDMIETAAGHVRSGFCSQCSFVRRLRQLTPWLNAYEE